MQWTNSKSFYENDVRGKKFITSPIDPTWTINFYNKNRIIFLRRYMKIKIAKWNFIIYGFKFNNKKKNKLWSMVPIIIFVMMGKSSKTKSILSILTHIDDKIIHIRDFVWC